MEHKTARVVNLRPPTVGTVPGTAITRLATSTTAAAVDLTVAGGQFFGKHLRLYNEDASNSVWIAFGTAAVAPISSATAGGTTAANSTSTGNAYRLAPGAYLDVRLTKALHPYLYTQASASTPVLAVYPVSPGVAGA